MATSWNSKFFFGQTFGQTEKMAVVGGGVIMFDGREVVLDDLMSLMTADEAEQIEQVRLVIPAATFVEVQEQWMTTLDLPETVSMSSRRLVLVTFFMRLQKHFGHKNIRMIRVMKSNLEHAPSLLMIVLLRIKKEREHEFDKLLLQSVRQCTFCKHCRCPSSGRPLISPSSTPPEFVFICDHCQNSTLSYIKMFPNLVQQFMNNTLPEHHPTMHNNWHQANIANAINPTPTKSADVTLNREISAYNPLGRFAFKPTPPQPTVSHPIISAHNPLGRFTFKPTAVATDINHLGESREHQTRDSFGNTSQGSCQRLIAPLELSCTLKNESLYARSYRRWINYEREMKMKSTFTHHAQSSVTVDPRVVKSSEIESRFKAVKTNTRAQIAGQILPLLIHGTVGTVVKDQNPPAESKTTTTTTTVWPYAINGKICSENQQAVETKEKEEISGKRSIYYVYDRATMSGEFMLDVPMQQSILLPFFSVRISRYEVRLVQCGACQGCVCHHIQDTYPAATPRPFVQERGTEWKQPSPSKKSTDANVANDVNGANGGTKKEEESKRLGLMEWWEDVLRWLNDEERVKRMGDRLLDAMTCSKWKQKGRIFLIIQGFLRVLHHRRGVITLVLPIVKLLQRLVMSDWLSRIYTLHALCELGIHHKNEYVPILAEFLTTLGSKPYCILTHEDVDRWLAWDQLQQHTHHDPKTKKKIYDFFKKKIATTRKRSIDPWFNDSTITTVNNNKKSKLNSYYHQPSKQDAKITEENISPSQNSCRKKHKHDAPVLSTNNPT